jgi:hypothetical protein
VVVVSLGVSSVLLERHPHAARQRQRQSPPSQRQPRDMLHITAGMVIIIRGMSVGLGDQW